ncbi:MAG: hypothetical protein GF398_17495 [Chitinivibrionales bacterium]|nr:hypothetical protein [Chitinivibrionales bacterium]
MKLTLKEMLTAPGLYAFFSKIRPFTGRNFFLLVFLGALLWYAIFTRQVIGRIENDAISVTHSYAELIRTAIAERMNDQKNEVVFREVIQKLNFPLIITDTTWRPVIWKNIKTGPFFNRRTITMEDTTAQSIALLNKKVAHFRNSFEPKTLNVSEANLKIGYLLYGKSDLVHSMAWMPFVEIALIIAVILFAYLAFHNIRVTERSNLWVALAKETAHQLGTPISSLMGWVEFMESATDPEQDLSPEEFIMQSNRVCSDMRNDLTRLRKITARFSQIGSVPDLTMCSINEILEDAMAYFSKRLPLLSKRIEIRANLQDTPEIPANRELIEWVLENLLKNSIDAIDKPNGLIEITSEFIEVDNIVRVFYQDNGKGISWEVQKGIFSPGYTTKKRGWGLGLTLAKRIVEDYHKGHIYVKWSQKDKGTIFCVDLPVEHQGHSKLIKGK